MLVHSQALTVRQPRNWYRRLWGALTFLHLTDHEQGLCGALPVLSELVVYWSVCLVLQVAGEHYLACHHFNKYGVTFLLLLATELN